MHAVEKRLERIFTIHNHSSIYYSVLHYRKSGHRCQMCLVSVETDDVLSIIKRINKRNVRTSEVATSCRSAVIVLTIFCSGLEPYPSPPTILLDLIQRRMCQAICTLSLYESASKIFRTGRLERELQMVQFFATRCSFIAILWVSVVSFVAVTLCVASQRVFIVVISLSTQSRNFWTHPCKSKTVV
jgi:hypothetical protein